MEVPPFPIIRQELAGPGHMTYSVLEDCADEVQLASTREIAIDHVVVEEE
ncbi:hypothetical protein FM113_07930 [Leucobacter sp. 7(1)]|nr:hypothetical protein FM113_07930 [Leucobacter sp. 7(1)]